MSIKNALIRTAYNTAVDWLPAVLGGIGLGLAVGAVAVVLENHNEDEHVSGTRLDDVTEAVNNLAEADEEFKDAAKDELKETAKAFLKDGAKCYIPTVITIAGSYVFIVAAIVTARKTMLPYCYNMERNRIALKPTTKLAVESLMARGLSHHEACEKLADMANEVLSKHYTDTLGKYPDWVHKVCAAFRES